MSKSLTKTLSILCAVALVAYLALLAATITFASVRTDVAGELRDLEARVGSLETQYYEAMATLNETSIASVGLVVPSRVEYVVENGTPTFTRAGYQGQ